MQYAERAAETLGAHLYLAHTKNFIIHLTPSIPSNQNGLIRQLTEMAANGTLHPQAREIYRTNGRTLEFDHDDAIVALLNRQEAEAYSRLKTCANCQDPDHQTRIKHLEETILRRLTVFATRTALQLETAVGTKPSYSISTPSETGNKWQVTFGPPKTQSRR